MGIHLQSGDKALVQCTRGELLREFLVPNVALVVLYPLWFVVQFWAPFVYFRRQLVQRSARGLADIAKKDVSLGPAQFRMVRLTTPSLRETLMYVCVSIVAVAGICSMLTHANSLRAAIAL